MSGNSKTDSQYLEFGPHTPEEPKSFTNYMSNAFSWFSRRSSAESNNKLNDIDKETNDNSNVNDGDRNWPISHESTPERLPRLGEGQYRDELIAEDRILQLINSHQKNEEVKISTFKGHWVPDEEVKKCSGCSEKFSFTKRKHHCRTCGLIYCGKCSDYWVDTKYVNCKEKIRLCFTCYQAFISLGKAEEPDLFEVDKTGSICYAENSVDQQKLPRESQTGRGFTEANYVSPRNLADTDIPYELYEAQRDEISSEMQLLLRDKNQLQDLYALIFWGPNRMTLLTHKHKLQSYIDTFTGKQLGQWLINNDRAASRHTATAIGQALLDAEYIVSVPKNSKFFLYDQSVYQPSLDKAIVDNTDRELATDEPVWAKDIPFEIDESIGYEPETFTSSTGLKLDVNLVNNVVTIKKDKIDRSTTDGENFTEVSAALTATVPLVSEENNLDGFMSEEALHALRTSKPTEDRTGSSSPDPERDALRDIDWVMQNNLDVIWQHHEEKLLKQLTTQSDLPEVWIPIIQSTARTIVQIIRPDTKDDSDNMDIRSYVHFKKLPGEFQRQCQVVNGTVFSKNVLHRSMKTNFVDPAILLVGSSIDFQSSTKQKYISMDSLRTDEDKVLSSVVRKIKSFRPDIVLVEDRLAYKASEQLRAANLTLVVGVKSSIMKRVARCTQAEIVENVHSLTKKPILGLCHSFYTHSYTTRDKTSKTLMYFDGCPTHAGCTLILKGPNQWELEKVKQIMYFMIFALYNSKLERGFLMKGSAFTSPSFLKHIGFPNLAEETANHKWMSIFDPSKYIADGPSPFQCSSESSDQSSRENEIPEVVDDPLQQTDIPPSPLSSLGGVTSGLKFGEKLDSVVLSISPYHRFKVPYLMSEKGSASPNAQFVPMKTYYSRLFEAKMIRTEHSLSNILSASAKGTRLPLHEFVTTANVLKASSRIMKTRLANFRAKGATFPYREAHLPNQEVQHMVIEVPEETESKPCYLGTILTRSKHIDSLHIMNHQSLPVMFCSFSVSHPTSSFCAGPDTLIMNFYGDNDICLGDFLEKYCFDTQYVCPSKCSQKAMTHKRRFSHGDGCIEVILQKVPDNVFRNSTINFWSWCRRCRKLSSIVPLSAEMWSLSFAKYIEMRLYEQRMTRRNSDPCNHSIHQDHHHYFIKGNIIAVFKYIVERSRELVLPPFRICYSPDPLVYSDTLERAKQLHLVGYGVFNGILQRLSRLAEDSSPKWESLLKSLFSNESQQRLVFKEHLESIQQQLDSSEITNTSLRIADAEGKEKACKIIHEVRDQICVVSILVLRVLNDWNSTVQEVTSSKKKDEKTDKTKNVHQHQRHNSGPTSTATRNLSSDDPALLLNSSNPEFVKDSNMDVNTNELEVDLVPADPFDIFKTEARSIRHSFTDLGLTCIELQLISSSMEKEHQQERKRKRLNTKKYSACLDEYQGIKDSINAILGLPREDVDDKFLRSNRDSSQHATRDLGRFLESTSDRGADVVDTPVPEKKPNAVRRMIANLRNPSSDLHIKSQFPADQHFGLLKEVRIPVVIVDEQPSSIVAHALSSEIYQKKLSELQKKIESNRQENSGFYSVSDSTTKSYHVELHFEDQSSNFYCKIFYAEQFRRFRSLVFQKGEDTFIRSLSTCVKWDAKGGKSGSSFCKTADDRFVLKQMSQPEEDSFTKFCPKYLNYIVDAETHKRPTCLTKIIGFYYICWKNSATGRGRKLAFLVMENLFYQRDISFKFDLKGSLRNRLVDLSGKQDGETVLLDENLQKMLHTSPLYLKDHCKKVITQAVRHDSYFLAEQFVMDYSLLVGIDNTRKEIVVGIIDYLRTFTWDKKLETMVKSTVWISGPAGATPTVVSPTVYRTRFCEAMDRYFVMMPDRWSSVGMSPASGIHQYV